MIPEPLAGALTNAGLTVFFHPTLRCWVIARTRGERSPTVIVSKHRDLLETLAAARRAVGLAVATPPPVHTHRLLTD